MIENTKKVSTTGMIDTHINNYSDNNYNAFKENGYTRFNANTNDETVGYIYRSYNYNQFKINKVNRPISKQHVKEIVTAIKAHNAVMPVIQVNPKMEIIDGQHRFFALHQLRMPIYYYVDRQLVDESIIQINSKQTRWHLMQFVHARSAQDYPNYQELEKIIKHYHNIAAPSAITMVFSKQFHNWGGKITKNVEEGEFTFGNKEAAIEFMDKLEEIHKQLTHKKQFGSRLIACLWAYYNRPEVNKEKLLGLVNDEFIMKLPRDRDGSLLFIGQRYNKKVRKKVKFSTDYKNRFHFAD